jgi:hypothetical protein
MYTPTVFIDLAHNFGVQELHRFLLPAVVEHVFSCFDLLCSGQNSPPPPLPRFVTLVPIRTSLLLFWICLCPHATRL